MGWQGLNLLGLCKTSVSSMCVISQTIMYIVLFILGLHVIFLGTLTLSLRRGLWQYIGRDQRWCQGSNRTQPYWRQVNYPCTIYFSATFINDHLLIIWNHQLIFLLIFKLILICLLINSLLIFLIASQIMLADFDICGLLREITFHHNFICIL